MIPSPLGLALKSAFKLEGIAVLSENMLYNVLCDLGGFEDSAEIKMSFKSFISSGHSRRLYNSLKKYKPLTPECNNDKIALQISREEVVFGNSSTSRPEVVKYIFDAIRYALDIDLRPETTSYDNERVKRRLLLNLFFALILALVTVLAVCIYFHKEVLLIDAENNTIVNLEGNYSIRVNTADGEKFFTGKISEVDNGEYSLYVVTEYGPEVFPILYDSDTMELFSSRLGKGKATVNNVTLSVTISFNNESMSWKLVK